MSENGSKKTPRPVNEAARAAALKKLNILEGVRDHRLDDIVRVAAHVCGTSISYLGLVDGNKEWLKSQIGLNVSAFLRDQSFAAHAINESDTFVVEDALMDERFANNPNVVGEYKFRFYAGALLQTKDGYNIGALSVIDKNPKSLDLKQIASLNALARNAMFVLEHGHTAKAPEKGREPNQNDLELVHQLPEMIFSVDAELRIQFVNRSFELFFNLGETDILGKRISSILTGDLLFEMLPAFERAQSGETQTFQLNFYRSKKESLNVKEWSVSRKSAKDLKAEPGEFYLIKISLLPRVRQGERSGFYGVMSDITQVNELAVRATEQSERLLNAIMMARTNEAHLHAIHENAPFGIVLLDSKLKALTVNKFFLKFIGKSNQDILGASIFDFIFADDRASFMAEMHRVLDQNEVSNRFDVRFLDQSSDIKSFHTSVCTFDINNKMTILLILECGNVDHLSSAIVEQGVKRIERSSKLISLGEKTAEIIREMNNPLSGIFGKTDLLKRSIEQGNLDKGNALQDLVAIQSQAEKIFKIISGLTTAVRSADLEKFEPVNLAKFIEKVIFDFKQRFAEAKLELRLNLEKDIIFECKQNQFSQALLSLLINAFEAIENSNPMWIEVKAKSFSKKILGLDQPHVSIAVFDSGPGVAAENIEKIMTPYFSTKSTVEGAGQGLSLAKAIVEQHSGNLYLEEVAAFTCFVIDMPRKQKNKA